MSFEWLYTEPPPEFIDSINKYAADGLTWAGIEKVFSVDAYDPFTGAPNLVAVDTTLKGYGLTKLAAAFPREILDKIAEIEHKPDRLHVVANALGATEKWGSNKNKDSFPRRGLQNADPNTYGHKTFLTAHIFKHHNNKNPKLAIGNVVESFYDDLMDKVLLLYYILKDKAPHIVDRLEKGESLEGSMGCRTPFDVCGLCDNKAKDRSEYCEHLKGPDLILPDGRKAMAHTPYPRFFDYSQVAKGADPIAKTLSIVDGSAKEAWDRRPLRFPMPGILDRMQKVAEELNEYQTKEATDSSQETLEYFLKSSSYIPPEHNLPVHQHYRSLMISNMAVEEAAKVHGYGSQPHILAREDRNAVIPLFMQEYKKHTGHYPTGTKDDIYDSLYKTRQPQSGGLLSRLFKSSSEEPSIGDKVKVRLEDRLKNDDFVIVPTGEIPGTLNKADGDPWDAIPIDYPRSKTEGTVSGTVIGRIEDPNGNDKLVVKSKPGPLTERQKEDLQAYQAARQTWTGKMKMKVPGVEDVTTKIGKNVQASIIKKIPAMSKAVDTVMKDADKVMSEKLASFAHDFLGVLEKLEPDLSTDFLDKLAENSKLGEILSSLTSKGIVLKPNEFDYLATKKADEAIIDDLMLKSSDISQRIIHKISEDILDARSSLPQYIYKRASIAASGSGGMNPQQMMQLLQLMQASQTPVGNQGQRFVLPPSTQQAIMNEAMLQMYRTNMGQMRPEAFAELPNMSLFPGHKIGSTSDFIEYCRGVPTLSYMKYAYTNRDSLNRPKSSFCMGITPSDFWYQEYVSKPREDLEKVSTVLSLGGIDILDAATTINLRFIRDVLNRK